MPRCLYHQAKQILRLFGGLSVFILVVSSFGLAQGMPNPITVAEELPNAPSRGGSGQSQDLASSATSASISGVVADIHGAAVPGCRVTLTRESEKEARVAETEVSGRFSFTNLPPGNFLLTIQSEGLESYSSGLIVLRT